MIQNILSIVCDVQVGIAVIVIISDGDTHAIVAVASIRFTTTAGSYESANDRRLHFGLDAKTAKIDERVPLIRRGCCACRAA